MGYKLGHLLDRVTVTIHHDLSCVAAALNLQTRFDNGLGANTHTMPVQSERRNWLLLRLTQIILSEHSCRSLGMKLY